MISERGPTQVERLVDTAGGKFENFEISKNFDAKLVPLRCRVGSNFMFIAKP